MRPASASSCLEVHVSHAAVVLLLDFVDEVSAWTKADDASCIYPHGERDKREARRRGDRYAQRYPAPSPVTTLPYPYPYPWPQPYPYPWPQP